MLQNKIKLLFLGIITRHFDTTVWELIRRTQTENGSSTPTSSFDLVHRVGEKLWDFLSVALVSALLQQAKKEKVIHPRNMPSAKHPSTSTTDMKHKKYRK